MTRIQPTDNDGLQTDIENFKAYSKQHPFLFPTELIRALSHPIPTTHRDRFNFNIVLLLCQSPWVFQWFVLKRVHCFRTSETINLCLLIHRLGLLQNDSEVEFAIFNAISTTAHPKAALMALEDLNNSRLFTSAYLDEIIIYTLKHNSPRQLISSFIQLKQAGKLTGDLEVPLLRNLSFSHSPTRLTQLLLTEDLSHIFPESLLEVGISRLCKDATPSLFIDNLHTLNNHFHLNSQLDLDVDLDLDLNQALDSFEKVDLYHRVLFHSSSFYLNETFCLLREYNLLTEDNILLITTPELSLDVLNQSVERLQNFGLLTKNNVRALASSNVLLQHMDIILETLIHVPSLTEEYAEHIVTKSLSPEFSCQLPCVVEMIQFIQTSKLKELLQIEHNITLLLTIDVDPNSNHALFALHLICSCDGLPFKTKQKLFGLFLNNLGLLFSDEMCALWTPIPIKKRSNQWAEQLLNIIHHDGFLALKPFLQSMQPQQRRQSHHHSMQKNTDSHSHNFFNLSETHPHVTKELIPMSLK